MDNKITISGPGKNFEGIKKIDENEVVDNYFTAFSKMVEIGSNIWK